MGAPDRAGSPAAFGRLGPAQASAEPHEHRVFRATVASLAGLLGARVRQAGRKCCVLLVTGDAAPGQALTPPGLLHHPTIPGTASVEAPHAPCNAVPAAAAPDRAAGAGNETRRRGEPSPRRRGGPCRVPWSRPPPRLKTPSGPVACRPGRASLAQAGPDLSDLAREGSCELKSRLSPPSPLCHPHPATPALRRPRSRAGPAGPAAAGRQVRGGLRASASLGVMSGRRGAAPACSPWP
jgi:hypothetical protein